MEKQQKIDTRSLHSFISLPGGKEFSNFIYTFHRAWNSCISIFIVDTFNFLLNPLFRKSLLGSDQLLSLIKCKLSRILIGWTSFCNRHSNWLNFRHYSGYRIKIKLICRKEQKQKIIDLDITTLELADLLRAFYQG